MGANSLCGTPEYLSPEVLDRKGHGTAVDWWNLGMVTYEMLTGLPPWYTTDRDKLFDRLRSAPLKFPYYVSRIAASLIQGLLVREPTKRLGYGGGTDVMKHQFFDGINWDQLYKRKIQPPYKPCENQDTINESSNFEEEFTSMPLQSVEEGCSVLEQAGTMLNEAFMAFTFNENSNDFLNVDNANDPYYDPNDSKITNRPGRGKK